MIEDLNLPNPVIRSHYRKGFLKQYVRDRFILRTETATNNISTDYGIGKAVENLPPLQKRLDGIIDRYLDVQQDILETFVDREELRQLTQPTVLPNGRRIPGLQLEQPRQLALLHSLVRFCCLAAEGTFHYARLISTDPAGTPGDTGRVQAWIPPLRSLEAARQGFSGKDSSFPSLPASPPRLSNPPGIPEALRKNLCSLDCRHSTALRRGPIHSQRKDHGSRSSIYCCDSGAGRPRRGCRFESSLRRQALRERNSRSGPYNETFLTAHQDRASCAFDFHFG